MTTKDVQNQQKSWAETPPINPPLRHIIGEYVENQTWLDTLSNPFQSWLLKLFGQPGEPNRKIKNMLNGTWLGHAVHPMLTDIPLGAWTGTTLLDIAALAGENKDIENSADLTLVLGLLGAGGAAVTGVTDWSDLDGTDRRVGMMHGLLNGSITVMYLVSLIMRRTGQRRAGVALSTLGYLTSLFSAYLGGEMVFAKGVGVNHVAWEGGSDDYVSVMPANDLPAGKLTRVDVAGIPAVLLKEGKAIYAIAATCSHLGGPLDEGSILEGNVVQCPWHSSCFRMTDGSVVDGPAVYAQPTFSVRVRNGNIELRRLEHA
ncbi:MAG: Rieske 2Fe-2S domain-containing protein [Ktedonobacteraceae bacterium]